MPYVLVDRIEYSNGLPWPTNASQNGLSLQRLVNEAYGNDPTNWLAAVTTPGAPNIVTPDDIDGDGLPNSWEAAYGLDPNSARGSDGSDGDRDADGLNNLQEFLSGTNPTDAMDYLHISSVETGAGVTRIRFQVVAGHSYTVQVREDLQGGPTQWRSLSHVDAQPGAAIVEVQDNAAATASRFYRLVTPALR